MAGKEPYRFFLPGVLKGIALTYTVTSTARGYSNEHIPTL